MGTLIGDRLQRRQCIFSESELDAKYIPGVLALFASLVRFESGKKLSG